MDALTAADIEAFDFEAWLISRGAQNVRGDEWLLVCPACRKRKLCVRADRRAWHCWICQRYEYIPGEGRKVIGGAGGLLDLLCMVDGLTREKARARVREFSLGVLRLADRPLREPAVRPQAGPMQLPEHWRPIQVLLPWMARRRLTVEMAQAYRIGWCPHGTYAGRIVFPVFDAEGTLIYWQARAMWDPQPGEKFIKTRNPPRADGAVASDGVLFGYDHVVRGGYKRVALTEGPMDAIRVGDDGVAAFGKRVTPAQVALLIRAGVREVDLMFDADAGPEVHITAPWLRNFFDVVRPVYLPWGDPDQHEREALHAYRAMARPI